MSVNERTGVVTGCKKLNVRSTGSINGQIIAVINRGTLLKVDRDSIGGKFYKVRVERPDKEDIEGYCMGQFVSLVIEESVLDEITGRNGNG